MVGFKDDFPFTTHPNPISSLRPLSFYSRGGKLEWSAYDISPLLGLPPLLFLV